MQDNSCKFFLRAYLFEADQPEIEIWVHELDPMTGSCRASSEWAREHFGNYGNESLRELLGLPITGGWQVIATGTLRGWFDSASQEWDEEAEIISVDEKKEIPADYYLTSGEAAALGEENPIEQLDAHWPEYSGEQIKADVEQLVKKHFQP